MNMEQSLLHMKDMFVAAKEVEWMSGQFYCKQKTQLLAFFFFSFSCEKLR